MTTFTEHKRAIFTGLIGSLWFLLIYKSAKIIPILEIEVNPKFYKVLFKWRIYGKNCYMFPLWKRM